MVRQPLLITAYLCSHIFPLSPSLAYGAGVMFQKARVEGVDHAGGRSEVVCSDGTRISGCMVLDATGHARKLVEYDKPFNPGYQVIFYPLI